MIPEFKNVTFITPEGQARTEYFITHNKVKLLHELTKELLIADQSDVRETKEILAENYARLLMIASQAELLAEIAYSTIQKNMQREVEEIHAQEKKAAEE